MPDNSYDKSRVDSHTLGIMLAQGMAMRADCRRRQVGAVILDPDDRVIGSGFNAAPQNFASCLDGACPRGLQGYESVPAGAPYGNGTADPGRCISVHAELAALLSCSPRDRMCALAIYVTAKPCWNCRTAIWGCYIPMIVTLKDNEIVQEYRPGYGMSDSAGLSLGQG